MHESVTPAMEPLEEFEFASLGGDVASDGAQLTFLRHGETSDTLSGVITGQRDIPLTDRGRSQVRRVALELASSGVDSIISSDLCRARESAAIIAQELGLPQPEADPRLRERHWGILQGTPRSHGRLPGDDLSPDGGESAAEFDRRVIAALAGLRPRTIVVTHAGVIRVALRRLANRTRDITPAGYVKIGKTGSRRSALRAIASVVEGGAFTGRVVHLASAADLPEVTGDSLVLLHRVEKSIAVDALARAGAAINLTRSLTAHITHGRTTRAPYAVALQWLDGLPANGDIATVAMEAPPAPPASATPIPDVPPLLHHASATHGGKAAGLHILEDIGFEVPSFLALSFEEAADPDTVALRCQRLHTPGCWAVRSSADVEDSVDDPMSGSFASLLQVPTSGVPDAVRHVVASAESAEIMARLASGSLARRPRMGVVIQRMVERPRLAGTVFLPAPGRSTEGILEARRNALADRLMSGTASPDISARFDSEGLLTCVEGARPPERAMVESIAHEALDIHRRCGRGDLEFAVDSQGATRWLQARVQPSVVEIVDRSGYHPAAAGYYRLLAAAVAPANLTPQTHFRLVELGGGRFGYSHGIRARDRRFHEAVELDPMHLARVAEHGWACERALMRALGDANEDPFQLWLALVMHGGAQLPFSIPVRSAEMDRFDSWSCDGDAGSPLLEQILECPMRGVLGREALPSFIRRLRTPCNSSAFAAQQEALAAIARHGQDAPDHLILAVLESEFRDVPELTTDGMAAMRNRVASMVQHAGTEATLLARARSACATNRLACAEADDLIREATRRNGEGAGRVLHACAGYLRMKADTNEFHALARGRVFTRLGRCGFAPSLIQVREWFAQLMRGDSVATSPRHAAR